MIQRCVVLTAVLLFSVPTHAETLEKTGTFNSIKVNYKVVLPNGYDDARPYPTVLAFAGGSQNMRIVNSAIERNWRAEAEKRGYVVIIPVAPEGRLFFQQGDRVFPEFIDRVLQDYKVENGKLHIAGSSNGGISAFHIAEKYPQYFRSVTGFPGYLQEDSDANIDRLKSMCIFMHVGELDSAWLAEMRAQADRFRQRGLHVRFKVEKGQQHSLRTLTGSGAHRLFDQFDEAAKGCK